MDFGQAVKVAGVLQKVSFFVLALPYSDCFYVEAFQRECTETFWEGHIQAFECFGVVPWRISYDNTRIAVSSILGVKEREIEPGFLTAQKPLPV